MKGSGPALMLPDKFVAHYTSITSKNESGCVFWIPRAVPISDTQLTDGWKYVMDNAYKIFDYSKWRLINSVVKLGSNPRVSYKKLFCSENASELLNHYGMHFTNPHTTNPRDIKRAALRSGVYGQMFLIKNICP